MYDLKELFLFSGLAEKDRDELLMLPEKPRTFEKGQVIYDPDNFRRAIGVFLSGKGTASVNKTQRALFSEGDVFGAAAIFGAGNSYVSKIIALSRCTVVFIDEEMLRKAIQQHPICGINYITFLSEKVRYLNGKIAEYTGVGAADRLLRLLLNSRNETSVAENVNIASLARLSGMGRTSIYRALAELEANGVIKRSGRDIIILSEAKGI